MSSPLRTQGARERERRLKQFGGIPRVASSERRQTPGGHPRERRAWWVRLLAWLRQNGSQPSQWKPDEATQHGQSRIRA